MVEQSVQEGISLQNPDESYNPPTLVVREMVDSERRPDRDWRWWMGCQPHIRALREAMHSATANSNREVENLLQKCISLYMAAIHHTSSLEDEKIYIAVTG